MLGVNLDCIQLSDLPPECTEECSRPGDCTKAVEHWQGRLSLESHLNLPLARKHLIETGAWDKEEVAGFEDREVAECILWLACCDFRDFLRWHKENPDKDPSNCPYGSDIYCLT